MSLKLRQVCADTLEQHRLSNFHIRIIERGGHKMMGIVSECGKPLVYIPGIQFTRNDPPMTEINYANELLDAFLVKHMPLILETIDAKKAFHAAQDAYDQTKNKYKKYNSEPHPNGATDFNPITEELTLRVDEDDTVTFHTGYQSRVTVQLIDRHKRMIPTLKKAHAELQRAQENNEIARAQYTELEQRLNTCDI